MIVETERIVNLEVFKQKIQETQKEVERNLG